MDNTLLILAAGMGSRYGGLKQLDRVGPGGETIADYSIYDAIRAGFDRVTFVIRKRLEQDFIDVFASKWEKKIEVKFAFQEMDTFTPAGVDVSNREKPWGTAHAVLAAADAVKGNFAVINADDFYGLGAYTAMIDFMNKSLNDKTYGLLGYVLKNTLSEHGGVSRGVCVVGDNNRLKSIAERKNVHRDGDVVRANPLEGQPDVLSLDGSVSMNSWCFPPSIFEGLKEAYQPFAREHFADKEELLLPGVIQDWMDSGKVAVDVIPCDEHWIGVTFKEDKPKVMAALQGKVDNGEYPASVYP